MDTKQCSKCGEEKPLSEYGRHRRHADGLQSQCKACQRVADKYFRATHVEELRAKYKAYNAKRRRPRTCYLPESPKYIARQKTNKAVAHGDLPPVKELVCHECGGQAEQYHHPDYKWALYVIPLCRTCHLAKHKECI